MMIGCVTFFSPELSTDNKFFHHTGEGEYGSHTSYSSQSLRYQHVLTTWVGRRILITSTRLSVRAHVPAADDLLLRHIGRWLRPLFCVRLLPSPLVYCIATLVGRLTKPAHPFTGTCGHRVFVGVDVQMIYLGIANRTCCRRVSVHTASRRPGT